MVDFEIVDYIVKSRDRGISKEKIEANLLFIGFSDVDIFEAFLHLNKRVMVIRGCLDFKGYWLS